MPCGGIYPIGLVQGAREECFNCGKPLGDAEVLAVEEWDAAIHLSCLRQFMGSAECAVIQEHQHPIITEMSEDGSYVKLLAFSPELSASDWALCHIDSNGDEVVDLSWSRMEYTDD